MTKEQEQVREFMRKAQQYFPIRPTLPSKIVQKFRLDFHLEEAIIELREAFENDDLVGVADSLTDSLVVILGTACACGIEIAPCWDEVHKSNMTKFIDGYLREDGKWIKGPSYSPAKLEPIIDRQLMNYPIEQNAIEGKDKHICQACGENGHDALHCPNADSFLESYQIGGQ